jgi:hypothetical protein
MLETKTFILGIGAQKAGTTWLHHYFCARPEVWTPPVKELHVLDVMFRPEFVGFRRRALQQLKDYIAQMDGDEYSEELRHLIDRVRAQSEQGAYKEYFLKRIKEQKLFTDITPSYSILPAEAFAFARSEFPRSKIIFILRDPVERHYSALRMRELKSNGTFNASDHFLKWLDRKSACERGLYHLTYRRVCSAFPAEDIFVGFYETLFCDAEIRRLCDFLEISFVPGDYSTVKNASAPRRAVDPEFWRAARETFAEVYAFCRAEFGSAVPENWS